MRLSSRDSFCTRHVSGDRVERSFRRKQAVSAADQKGNTYANGPFVRSARPFASGRERSRIPSRICGETASADPDLLYPVSGRMWPGGLYNPGCAQISSSISGLLLTPEDRAHLLWMMRRQTPSPVHRRMNACCCCSTRVGRRSVLRTCCSSAPRRCGSIAGCMRRPVSRGLNDYMTKALNQPSVRGSLRGLVWTARWMQEGK